MWKFMDSPQFRLEGLDFRVNPKPKSNPKERRTNQWKAGIWRGGTLQVQGLN